MPVPFSIPKYARVHAMKIKSLEDLYLDELRDLYSAETQLVKALPKMAKAVSSSDLRQAIEEHLEQTKGHVQRLEQIFERLDARGRGRKCKAMEGLIEEGKELIDEDPEPAILDAGIIAAAQKVEHYEMAGYGCVRTWAQQLGDDDAAHMLQQTLDEEGAADKKLTELAVSLVNQEAVGAGTTPM
jgi:ferritin-like metal-binding protein YciE